MRLRINRIALLYENNAAAYEGPRSVEKKKTAFRVKVVFEVVG